MAGTWYKLILYFTLFCYVSSEKCEQKGPCRCEFLNGTGIDLSPSIGNEFISANHFTEQKVTKQKDTFKLSTYFFHPCSDAKPKVDSQGACSVPLSVSTCKLYVKLNLAIYTNY